MPPDDIQAVNSNRQRLDASQPNARLFDGAADTYAESLGRSVGRFGEAPDQFVQVKVELIRDVLRDGGVRRIIDIGCGIGLLTERLARALPAVRIIGVDSSPRSLELAESRCRRLDNVVWRLSDGSRLPVDVGPADLAILANVMHHVVPSERRRFLHRVVLPAVTVGGRIVLFEHNPYNPLTRLVVRSCPYDRDASLLTRQSARRLLLDCRIEVARADYIVFFPRPLRRLRRLEGYLRWLPAGAQYMIVGRRGEGDVG